MPRNLNVAQAEPRVKASAPRAMPQPASSLPEKRKAASTGSAAFGAMIAALIVYGWLKRGSWPNAEAGVGYYLGIIGGVSMLALLLYPMRKHAPFMRKAGPVSFWFRTHMALGLIGPTLILYHANFTLGSINANVALWSMLCVAGSGVIGRIVYAKIHKGLFGVKADLRNLASEAAALRAHFGADLDQMFADRFDDVEKGAFAQSTGMGGAMVKMAQVTGRARALHADLRRRLKKQARKTKRRAEYAQHLEFYTRYFRRVEQAAELGFYERIFSAWHLLHLPLFFLLILTAIVHVIAVHLY